MKEREDAKDAARAKAQVEYNEGHEKRPSGASHRRQRSADYERRGDRLRKESPLGRAEERVEKAHDTAAALRSKLRNRRASGAFDSAARGTSPEFNYPSNIGTLGRKIADEDRGRSRSPSQNRNSSRYRSGRKRGFLADRLHTKTVSQYELEFADSGADDRKGTRKARRR